MGKKSSNPPPPIPLEEQRGINQAVNPSPPQTVKPPAPPAPPPPPESENN